MTPVLNIHIEHNCSSLAAIVRMAYVIMAPAYSSLAAIIVMAYVVMA